jgi:hypothetical protein
MNAFPRRSTDPVDTAELGRLLPAPADPDLPSDRHRLLREHLMREIHQHDPAAAATRRRHRTRRRVAFTVAPVAVAAAAAVAVVAVAGLSGHPGRPATGNHTATTHTANAAALLDKVALASNDTTQPAARDDQFVYIDSKVAWSGSSNLDPTPRLGAVHDRRVWLSVDGTRDSWVVEPDNGGGPLDASLGTNARPSLDSPTYKYLTTWPTDPDKLLAMLHAEIRRTGMGGVNDHDGGVGLDQETFTVIGDIIRENLVPPKLSAALYQAAAKIPGVTVLPDVADAAGRHGVAVARTGKDGTREAWIFDRGTYTFLGEREDNPRTGKVSGISAILTRTVVDHVKDLPK